MPEPTDSDDPDRLLRPSQAAVLLGVSPATLWRWAIDGRVPFRRTVGGQHRYRRGDIIALAEAS